MGTPAVAMGDRIVGTCAIHTIPGPTGAPQPGPPFPFSAPLTMAVVPTVLVGGKPAVVVGCSGMNVPPHVGLHPADPFFTPAMQVGRVVAGSVRVLIGGKPAATQAGSYTCCGTPGQVVASGTTVLIG